MQRIYFPNKKFTEILEITDTEIYHQLTRVMRARLQEQVVFFDGVQKEDVLYSIIHIDKKSVSLKRETIIPKSSELFSEMILYQALPNKLSKLEYIIQKCCEIGYSKIILFTGDHSQKWILGENKKERLVKIAIEAIEQCGGNIIPEIDFYDDISQLQNNIVDVGLGETYIFCHTQAENSHKLLDIDFKGSSKTHIFIGPEGGFSQTEIKGFEKNNIQQVHFGERILRCETVAPAVGFYLSQQKK